METQDTIRLLRECDAGVKMASASLDDVMKRAANEDLHRMLQESRQAHRLIGRQIRALLEGSGSDEKDPSPIARSMSAVKAGVKLGLEDSDRTVADLITDGCGMGIKSLHRYLNQYQNASCQGRTLCRMLIAVEEQLVADVKRFL